MENFDAEKIKIQIRVRKLFREPLRELVGRVPAISPQELDKIMAILWQVSGNSLAISRQDFCTISAIFPALLSALEGNFSEDRIKYLAEFTILEAKNRLIKA